MIDPAEFGKQMGGIVREATAPLLKRIEAMEVRQPERGEKGERGDNGRDGDSPTAESIAKEFQPALESMAKTWMDACERKYNERIEKFLSSIPAPKDGERGPHGERGESGAAGEKGERGEQGVPGERGKDADPVDVEFIADRVMAKLLEAGHIKTLTALEAAEAVSEYIKANPVRDGRDGRDGKDGSAGPRGESGEKGSPGADGIGMAGAMIDREGELIITTTKGEPVRLGKVVGKDGASGKDGADFTEVTIDYDGERGLVIRGKGGDIVKTLPIPMDAGYYRDGMSAEKGDIVTHDGNAWIALRATKAKPSHEAKEDWRLFARKGRDGRDGAHGRDLGPAPPVKLAESINA